MRKMKQDVQIVCTHLTQTEAKNQMLTEFTIERLFSLFIYDMWNYNGATEINLTKQEIEQIATWTKTS